MDDHEQRLRESMRERIDEYFSRISDQAAWQTLLLNLKVFLDEFALAVLATHPQRNTLKTLVHLFRGTKIGDAAAEQLLEMISDDGTVDHETLVLLNDGRHQDLFEEARMIRERRALERSGDIYTPNPADHARIVQRMIAEGRL